MKVINSERPTAFAKEAAPLPATVPRPPLVPQRSLFSRHQNHHHNVNMILSTVLISFLSSLIQSTAAQENGYYPGSYTGASITTCLNDGAHPQYMEEQGLLNDSLEDCCEQFYIWNVRGQDVICIYV